MTPVDLEAIWRAVLAHLAVDGYRTHDGCESDPPEECSLYHAIKEATEKEGR